MAQRGKKQSMFIGRRVPEVDEAGVPILYKRYTNVEEILVSDDVEGAAQPVAAAGKRSAGPASTSGAGDQQGAATKKSKKEKRQRDAAANGEIAAAATASQNGEEEAAEPSAKKAKRDKKAKQAAQNGDQQQQANGAAAAADGRDAEQQQQQPQAAPAGNADEATKIRSVLGFSGASSAAAPSFNFEFSVEAQVARETEEKLARIRMVDAADAEGYVPRRVFVGGMPFSADEAAIRDYWSYCGEIEGLDMLTFPDTGRFRGIAFITFTTEEAYQKALACNGEVVDGQTLKVDRCKAAPPKKGRHSTPNAAAATAGAAPAAAPVRSHNGTAPKTPGYDVAYVGNIAFEVTPQQLQELFGPLGATKVRLHTDKVTGKPKGFAHVHFDNEADLDRCVELDGTELQGRKIRVGYAQPKK